MTNNKSPIIRSQGSNYTEEVLSKLCDKTFLKLWVYPNAHKKIGKELCDVLVIFEEHVFIFSVKDISFNKEKGIDVSWNRWEKKAIDKSITQINQAEKWIKTHPDKIFLDAKCENKIPIDIDLDNYKIHRIVVAHGAEQACKEDSINNAAGSLAISYSDTKDDKIRPFFVNLPRDKIYHVFDSFNLDIILGELDTICDFLWYLEAKENAIEKYELSYCGEEDLLAHYLYNFDKKKKCHYIGTKKKGFNYIHIGEGKWHNFALTQPYLRKKEEDKISYFWDKLLNNAFQQAHEMELIVDGGFDVYNDESAFHLMAKEPRFARRVLSKGIEEAINNFSEEHSIFSRFLSSYYSDFGYILLQVKPISEMDYESEYRLRRRMLLEVSCARAKIKQPNLTKVVGIAIDAPKYSKNGNSEDFLWFDFSNWSESEEDKYKKLGKDLGFSEIDKLQITSPKKTYEFPPDKKIPSNKHRVKIGRNDPCPCGSNKKYKKCCLKLK